MELELDDVNDDAVGEFGCPTTEVGAVADSVAKPEPGPGIEEPKEWESECEWDRV